MKVFCLFLLNFLQQFHSTFTMNRKKVFALNRIWRSLIRSKLDIIIKSYVGNLFKISFAGIIGIIIFT